MSQGDFVQVRKEALTLADIKQIAATAEAGTEEKIRIVLRAIRRKTCEMSAHELVHRTAKDRLGSFASVRLR
jgi:hypothetical protein